MNKIFKIVWSKARECYVVVSEFAKNQTKGCSTAKLFSNRRAMKAAAAVVMAGALVGISGVGEAVDRGTNYIDTDEVVYGYNNKSDYDTDTKAVTIGLDNGVTVYEDAQAVSVGVDNLAYSDKEGISVAFGVGNDSDANRMSYSVALGVNNTSSTEKMGDAVSVGVGNTSDAGKKTSVSMGAYNKAGVSAVALGISNKATNEWGVAMGRGNYAGYEGISVGNGNNSSSLEWLTKYKDMDKNVISINLSNYDSVASDLKDGEYPYIFREATAVGFENYSYGDKSTAVGYRNLAAGKSSTAIGNNNLALNKETTAIGAQNEANNKYAVAVGYHNRADNESTSAIGKDNRAMGKMSSAVGYGNTATGESSAAIGKDNSSNSKFGAAIGVKNQVVEGSADWIGSAAIGYGNFAEGSHAVAIGSENGIDASYSVGVGYDNDTSRDSTVLVGIQNIISGDDDGNWESVAMGLVNTVKSKDAAAVGVYNSVGANSMSSTALGTHNEVYDDCENSVAMGYDNGVSESKNASSVGVGNYACGDYATAVGYGNTVCGEYSSAFGYNNDIESESSKFGPVDNATAIGYKNIVRGNSGTAIGYRNSATSENGVAVGNFNAVYNATSSVAMGYANEVRGSNTRAASIGVGNMTFGDRSSVIGVDNTSYNAYATAVGYSNEAHGDKATAVGYDNIAAANSTVVGYGNTTVIEEENSNEGWDIVGRGTQATAVGYQNTASNLQSVAVGWNNEASAYTSVAMGHNNRAVEGTGVQNAIAIGIDNIATESHASAIGYDNTATGGSSSAIGDENSASGHQASAFGAENIASGEYASAFGYNNTAAATDSVAMGHKNNVSATAQGASAIGYENVASATSSTAIGHMNQANGYGSVAIGHTNYTKSTASDSAAVGFANQVWSNGGSAIGQNNSVYNNAHNASAFGKANSISAEYANGFGYENVVYGLSSAAFGNKNSISAAGEKSLAVGYDNNVSGLYAAAVGSQSKATAQNAVAVGHKAYAEAKDALAIGTNTQVTVANNVALGANALANTAAEGTSSATINNVTYGGFAGTAPVGTVSVGQAGKERTITNVAAGRVTATSTDAINGSQLYAVANTLTAKTNIGNTDNNIVVTPDNAGTNVDLADDVHVNKSVSITKPENKKTTTTTMTYDGVEVVKANDDGSSESAEINHNTIVVASTDKKGVVKETRITATKVQSGQLFGSSQVYAGTLSGEDGEIFTKMNKDQFEVHDKNSTSGDPVSRLTKDTLEIGNYNYITKTGIHANDKKITNVADGEISATSTDAVNGSQLYALEQKVGNMTDTNTTYTVGFNGDGAGAVTLDEIGKVDADGNPVPGITILKAADGLKIYQENGINYIGLDIEEIENDNMLGAPATSYEADDKKEVGPNDAGKLTITGGADVKSLTEKNIGVVSNAAGDGLEVKLSKDINLTDNGSLTIGVTKIDNSGVSVDGKKYITKDGLNANDKKITNVADGEISANSKDAVNGSQLYKMQADNAQMNQRINETNDRVNRVGAGAAALAALHPQAMRKGESQVMAGLGRYKGKSGAAVGAAWQPSKNVMVNGGFADAAGEMMFNVGVSYKFGQKSYTVEELQAMNTGNGIPLYVAELNSVLESKDAKINALESDNKAMRAELNELKAVVAQLVKNAK